MRTGKEYISNLKGASRDLWLDGRSVRNLDSQPSLINSQNAIAGLYDLQFDIHKSLGAPFDKHSPSLAVKIPKSQKELRERGQFFYRSALYSGGMLGRTPDYLNAIVASWAAAADSSATPRHDFASNIREYHSHLSEKDLFVTHSVINAFRVSGSSRVLDTARALRVVKETENGIVVNGVRHLATSAAISDEIAIYSGRSANHRTEEKEFALAFAVNTGTPGIRLIARESFRPNDVASDSSLSARFDEIDYLLSFENVLIPWDRVFVYQDADRLNKMHRETNSVVHSAHQTAWKCVAKTEFVVGALLRFVAAHDCGQVPHVQQAIAEGLMALEVMRSLTLTAESRRQHRSVGVFAPRSEPLEVARVTYMKLYETLIQQVKDVASGNLMLLFSNQNLKSKSGLADLLGDSEEQAADRLQMNRLLWEVTSSAFGTRQVMYEKLYAGGIYPSLQFLYKTFSPTDLTRIKNLVDDVIKEI